MAPCRVLDSRLPAGTPPFSATKTVNVTASNCGVPAAAKAFVFNATVVPPGFLGYFTMWPQGQSQPLAATLNAYDGAITHNMAIVPTNNGSIRAFPFNPTHLVLDLQHPYRKRRLMVLDEWSSNRRAGATGSFGGTIHLTCVVGKPWKWGPPYRLMSAIIGCEFAPQAICTGIGQITCPLLQHHT